MIYIFLYSVYSFELVLVIDVRVHYFCPLKASVPVDVMPGQYDPTNYTLPQQPLHRCMFPLSTPYPTLQLVSNPYKACVDGVR